MTTTRKPKAQRTDNFEAALEAAKQAMTLRLMDTVLSFVESKPGKVAPRDQIAARVISELSVVKAVAGEGGGGKIVDKVLRSLVADGYLANHGDPYYLRVKNTARRERLLSEYRQAAKK